MNKVLKRNITKLLICGGGFKFFYIVGALKYLDEINILQNINEYIGVSAGAVLSLFFNIGYTLDELDSFFLEFNFEKMLDPHIDSLLDNKGLDDGELKKFIIQHFLKNKNYHPSITFKELYEKTGKVLTFTTTNITSGKVEYHNHITQPNMQILLSLRMSINIPIVYSPIQYNNNYYVDGALLDCYPYNYNKNLKKIGIFLINRNEYLFLKNKDSVFVNNIDDTLTYLKNLLSIMYLNNLKNNFKNNLKKNKNTINIITDSNIELYDFNLDENNKKKMINLGKVSFNKYFKKIYLIRRKRFLMNKYYYLWKFKSLLK